MVLPAFGGFPMQHTDHHMMLEVRKSKRLDVKSVAELSADTGPRSFSEWLVDLTMPCMMGYVAANWRSLASFIEAQTARPL